MSVSGLSLATINGSNLERKKHFNALNFSFISTKLLSSLQGRVKKKKKSQGIFPKGEGGPTDFGSISLIFLIVFFIFKHGLNHPEMQRNFFSPLGDPPPLPSFLQQIDYISLGVPLELGKGTPEKKKKNFFALKHFLEPIYQIKKMCIP